MDKLLQAFVQLLPAGFAWPRHPDSVLMRWLRGLAGTHAELLAFIRSTIRQWIPHLTTLRLSEWEEACGLPDPCFGPDADEDARRRSILTKLRGLELPFRDSSLAAPHVLKTLCESLGYSVDIFYSTPFRVGHKSGRSLGDLDGKLRILADTTTSTFRVGSNVVGDRLFETHDDLFLLLCYLRKVAPARFEIVVLPKME